MEGWKVDKTVTTSNHNAITFEIRVESHLKPLRSISTQKFNFALEVIKILFVLGKSTLTEDNNVNGYRKYNRWSRTGDHVTSLHQRHSQSMHKYNTRCRRKKGKAALPWWIGNLKVLKK
ncbi:hypothetical protein EVAR_37409_1 [Eumeta japonica]|uniref:Uncharacterized protein n=1 Tax=Eumeta variegata TaxID=151549 RepID=A0A4C1WHM1_EUMVA|nr:hypothetical protein EVAR_37409_1 [Eumeta japonica]